MLFSSETTAEPRTDSHLQTILTVLPVLTAGLYLMGDTYHKGYLAAFGVEDSLFPLTFEKTLLSGFYAAIAFLLVPLLYSIPATLFLVLAVMLAAVLASSTRVKHWQSIVLAKLPKGRATNAPSGAMKYYVDKSTTISGYSIGGFLVAFSLVFAAILSAKSGLERAGKEIRLFNDQAINYAILYSPLLPEPTRSKQIICNPSHCAFWLGSESLVLRHESIECVVMRNIAVEGTLGDKAAQRPSPCTLAPR